ncbi:MAG TPA: Uma2 family endonuclease [Thermoanaerobaculia bacterium]|jgi:Uma2 family endonuclease|nr:Uma2 family endonuclease [Thermoanaerobaculia bacterium]
MAREYAVQLEESLLIPAAARSFEGFRKWARSPAFPETGRIDFLAGDLEIDMSPEDLHTHGTVKVAIASTLHTLVADGDQGEVFVDRARVVSRFAALSVEPDTVVVLWDSLRSGRVRYVPSDPEIEGAPDVIIEVVSDGSVRKDTQRLPPLYARAGIPELWLVDTRKEPLRFDIHLLQDGRYVRVEPDAEGWSRSERLGRFFRLTRRKTPVGTWGYRLEWREG